MKSLHPTYLVGSLLFAVASVISQPALAEVNLLMSIYTHNAPRKADTKVPPDSQESLEVTLADGFISVKSAQNTSIFDFKTRRRIVLDNTTKSYVGYSLYDTVGFRTLEFKNREMLNGALTAAKITGAPMAMVDNEHILSLQSRSPTKIDEAINGDDMVFSSDGRQLARWSKKGFEVSVTDAERFAKFLRYSQGGHPIVLGKLAVGNLIPNKLIFTFTEIWGTSSRSVSIKALRQVDSSSNDLSSYSTRKAVVSSDSLDNILDQAVGLTREEMETAKTLNQNGVEKAFRDGQILDAMLGLLERTLMTGQQVQPFSSEQLIKVRSDPSVQKFTVALGAKTKEDVAEAIKTLVELRSQAPNKSYVLKIFEANDRRLLGDFVTARKLFMESLQSNLLLAGVYKDFGDLLLMQYNTPMAWRCWDAGRHLAPQFGNFEAVNQFEKSLVAQHPEYF